jgi:hypothetical protein
MFTVMFSGFGVLALNDLPNELKTNRKYCCDVVLEEVRRALIGITKKNGIGEALMRMDNCKGHN